MSLTIIKLITIVFRLIISMLSSIKKTRINRIKKVPF